PYGIRTRVTAVKRRCLNPLTNGPELLFSTLTIIPTFSDLSTTFSVFFKLSKKSQNYTDSSIDY
ncbi:hypothetical protein, partial [Streptococcus vulneris]|uniref:hypothetical protein n=1 Tax=Streptococcus vulneris TaxID=2853160 RepID=UPI001C43F4E9